MFNKYFLNGGMICFANEWMGDIYMPGIIGSIYMQS